MPANLAGFWIALCSGPPVRSTSSAVWMHTPEHADPRPKTTNAEGIELFFFSVTHFLCLQCISSQDFSHTYLLLNSIEALSVIARAGNCPSGEYVFGKTPVTSQHYCTLVPVAKKFNHLENRSQVTYLKICSLALIITNHRSINHVSFTLPLFSREH